MPAFSDPPANGPDKDGSFEPGQFDPARADNQSDYIAVCDTKGLILYVNPALARALGYPPAAMAGTPFSAYAAEECRDDINSLAATGGTAGMALHEAALLSSDGLTRSVLVRALQIRYNGSMTSLLFLIDITERKTLEEKLAARADELQQISTAYRQANKKLTLLSTITRHDINNQLTVIKGYLGIIGTEQTDPALEEYCTKAITAAERIEGMIRFTSEYEKVGITAPVWQDSHAIADAAGRQAPLGGIVLTNDLPSGMEIFADPLIEKVFYNLLENAVRYGGTISAIRFHMLERNGSAIIFCDDDGVGVPSGDKERIFGRGFGKNTGLGLALSREILNITGISIQETGEPGRGARFEITVPAGAWRRIQSSSS